MRASYPSSTQRPDIYIRASPHAILRRGSVTSRIFLRNTLTFSSEFAKVN